MITMAINHLLNGDDPSSKDLRDQTAPDFETLGAQGPSLRHQPGTMYESPSPKLTLKNMVL